MNWDIKTGDARVEVPKLREAGCRFRLIHSDLPFNTGTTQKGPAGEYEDRFDNYADFLDGLIPCLRDVMTDNGLLALQLDDREYGTLRERCTAHMPKGTYRGTLIWSYATGGVSRSWWSLKHQYIVLFSRYPDVTPIFHLDRVPTIPRKAAPKTVNGKTYDGDKRISSVWEINWSTTDPSRTGYPSQKPLQLAQRLIEVHTNELDWVLDPCCGSGTTGAEALAAGRRVVLIDSNPQATSIAMRRLSSCG